MKLTEIAARVFTAVEPLGLTDIEGGPLTILIGDLSGLALVPWFCEGSIQWALRVTLPGKPLKKSFLKRVGAS